MNRRRVRRVAVMAELFIRIGQEGLPKPFRIVEHALPADAVYVYSAVDPKTGRVWLFVESASFDEVGEGDIVPEHPEIQFEEIRAAEERTSG